MMLYHVIHPYVVLGTSQHACTHAQGPIQVFLSFLDSIYFNECCTAVGSVDASHFHGLSHKFIQFKFISVQTLFVPKGKFALQSGESQI